jgi:hypothetical protein
MKTVLKISSLAVAMSLGSMSAPATAAEKILLNASRWFCASWAAMI